MVECLILRTAATLLIYWTASPCRRQSGVKSQICISPDIVSHCLKRKFQTFASMRLSGGCEQRRFRPLFSYKRADICSSPLVSCENQKAQSEGKLRNSELYPNSRVRIEFIDFLGEWQALNETQLQFVPRHKERILAGQSSAENAAAFRVIGIDTGKVLDRWYSDGD